MFTKSLTQNYEQPNGAKVKSFTVLNAIVDLIFLCMCGQVLVPIGFGTEEMEAVIIVDVLRRAGADVTVASVEPQLEIEASGGIKLVADTSISACSNQTFDLVALPVSFWNYGYIYFFYWFGGLLHY